jgi:CBS domain-containing protein
MLVKDLTTDEILPLKTSDSCAFALWSMEENRVRHLPVVNERELLGLVSEFDVINHGDQDEPLGNIVLSLHNAFVTESQHVFDALKIVSEMRLSLVPVVNARNEYLGLITLEGLIGYFARNTYLMGPGAILVLRMNNRSYSMSEVAQIVESNDARILCSFLTSWPDSTMVDLTLKVNTLDIAPLIQTFNRFNYEIRATFAEKDDLDELKERYDSLMNYLNI